MSEPQRPNILPVVIGIALTCILLAGLAYLARSRKAADARRAVPHLTILAPTPSATVDSPLIIRFASSHPLELRSSGWGYQTLHLHAALDGIEHMPAAAAVAVLNDSIYEWTLPVPRASLMLHLGWADGAHRPVAQGGSDTIQVHVR